MIILEQFSARPLVVALSQSCTYTLRLAPTKCLDVKCGAFKASRRFVHNFLNILPIACLHSYPNSMIYPMKLFMSLSRKEKLSCFRVSSTLPIGHNPNSDDCRSGNTIAPSVLRQLAKFNIIGSCRPGEYSGLQLCPQCGGGSTRHRSLRVFIFPDGNCAVWRCNRSECNWGGITMGTPMSAGHSTPKLNTLVSKNASSNTGDTTIRNFTEEYIKLEPISDEGTPMSAGHSTPKLNTLASKNASSNTGDTAIRNFTEEYLKLEPISDELCDYFASRMISRKTLQRNAVMQTIRYDQIVIAFMYRRNGKIVNCKYRDVHKRFWQEKHCEKIPYGLDDIKGARDIIIVEGEIDKLSMEEAGYRNCISVPEGAPRKVSTKELPTPEQDKKYEFLWNSKEYFKQASRIILATDADKPGQALAEELARRLGHERCWRVTWPRISETANKLCKDANEVLIFLGQQALKKVIEGAKVY